MESSLICPADCGKSFKTQKGLSSHLTQASSCLWYRAYQKSVPPDTTIDQDDLANVDELMRRHVEGDVDITGEDAAALVQELEEENNPFHFVPLEEVPPTGVAGPGPSTQAYRDRLADRQLGGKVRELDDGDLSMFEVEHQDGGAVIRMDDSLHARWRVAHSLPLEDIPMDGSTEPVNIYSPFASEMDWRVAEWVVKEDVGHNSFNRFLQIPGVSCYSFLLEPTNTHCRLLKNLDFHIKISKLSIRL